jgi:predicted nucleic acid-binding protein
MGPARVALSCSKLRALIRSNRSCASEKRSAIAVADALKSALRLLPAQILRELAHVIKRTAALPAQALEITLRFAIG